MDLTRKLLARGERVRLTSRPHPLGLARQLARRALQLVVCAIVLRLVDSQPVARFLDLTVLADFGIDAWLRPIPEWIRLAVTIAASVVLVMCLVDGLRWRSTRFVLTEQRVLQFQGVVVQLIVDTPLDQVTDVAVRQSLLGRQLDYGDLVIRTAADDEGRPMLAMRQPFAFRQAMEARRQARVFAERGGAGSSGSAAPAAPIEAVRRGA